MNLKTGEFMSQFLESKTVPHGNQKKQNKNCNQEIQIISDIEKIQRISYFKNILFWGGWSH